MFYLQNFKTMLQWYKIIMRLSLLILKNNKNLTVDISLISVFTAIICICSWISIPFLGIPFSLQTFAVFTCAAVIGAEKSIISVLVYILLGITGLPVFSGFRSGLSVLLGPTGGYLIGFIAAAFIIGITIKILPSYKISKILAMIMGQTVCYFFAAIWYRFVYIENAVSFKEILSACVIPFIVPDIIKIIAAVILSDSVIRIFKKQNIDTI